jgi:hypothetical protein
MKKLLVAVCAAIAVVGPAGAVELPTLSQFLLTCSRSPEECRSKIRNYVDTADRQKVICRPADQSLSDATYETLHWLRENASNDEVMRAGPYDDGLWAAVSTMWPCKSE